MRKKGIWDELFDIKHFLLNIVYLVIFIHIVGVTKVGMVMQSLGFFEGGFEIWMWACFTTIFILLLIFLINISEGFFVILEGILLIILMLPMKYFDLRIVFWLFIIGVIGFFIYKLKEIKRRKKCQKLNKNLH